MGKNSSPADSQVSTFRKENFKRRTRYTAVFIVLLAALFVVIILNINTGNVNISVGQILRIIFTGGGTGTEYNIIWKIRFSKYYKRKKLAIVNFIFNITMMYNKVRI